MFHIDKGVNPKIKTLQAILLGGGSGSGKSKVVVDVIGTDGFVVIDADEIKKVLPEYQKAVQANIPHASDIVHKESSEIAKRLFNEMVNRKECLIYDGTMKNREKYRKLIKLLSENGYIIQMIIVDADFKIALERADNRYEKEGRFVSEKIIMESNKAVAKSFLDLKDDVDQYLVFNNDSNTENPKLIAYKNINEELVVLNERLYAKFKQKAKLF
ncbi:zeta toxin family protein [Bacillus sp. 1P06AnD]|uniref:zeta toxin family protein n=1 Tax=Bacillus sp. 1P06AnD TaxID=3132208 RepID=UPI0039A04B50